MTKAEKNRMNGKLGGRPKGSTTKPRLSDYLSEEEVKALVQVAKDMAIKGDGLMLKFVLDHHFGKAIQPTDITTQGEKIIQPLTDLNALLANNVAKENSPAPKEN